MEDKKDMQNNHIPKVSIGMPVFNDEMYVSRAIDDLLAQTYQDFELIISDNASTDTTGEICKRYAKKDLRIQYFRQAKNMGYKRVHARIIENNVGSIKLFESFGFKKTKKGRVGEWIYQKEL